MTEHTPQQSTTSQWRNPRTFWIANLCELCERAAYYGMFIALDLYLSRKVGFTDVQAHAIAGPFTFFLYLLPPFVGAMADKIGFRRALMMAFAFLAAGYWLLGAYHYKGTAIASLALIIFGGAIIKPTISGTAALCSDSDTRVKALSIFYMMVNIGAFFGKTIAAPLRTGLDVPFIGHLELGLEYIHFFAAGMCALAFVLIALFYKNVDTAGQARSLKQVAQGFARVVTHGRFMCLILIVAGFWLIQGQLYSCMPKYILRLLGEAHKPEWLANINPLVVVLFVRPIAQLVKNFKPENAIGIGMFLIPITALCIASSAILESIAGDSISVFGLFSIHPITLLVIVGIGLQGLAECFLSPKFLEFASKQAPPGEVGLYMGYQNLSTAIAWLLGFLISGFLLAAYCPDPTTLDPESTLR